MLATNECITAKITLFAKVMAVIFHVSAIFYYFGKDC
jgi:hypothetical protein